MKLEEVIKPYCLVELFYNLEFIEVCNDECEIVDGVLHVNEDPDDDVELQFITRVWHYNVETQSFYLVWEKDKNETY